MLYPTKGACSLGIDRTPFDVDGISASDQSQGRAKRQAGRLHFGPGLHSPLEFAVEIDGALLVVAHPLRIHPGIQHVIGSIAEVHPLGALETADEQPRGNQQYQRAGYLPRDQQAANALALGTARIAAAAIVQRRAGFGPRNAQSRPDPDETARKEGSR